MKICSVQLKHFRNHVDTSVFFAPGINVFLGNNGAGKTSMLEAVAFLSLTKSFYASTDATALMVGKETFELQGAITSDAGTEHQVRVVYSRSTGEKRFTIDRSQPETLASVIGRFPVVVLSPENNGITMGGPSDRRRFMDLALSQLARVYFEELLEYRRVVKQRNRILLNARLKGADCIDAIEPWNDHLVHHGSRIMARRSGFLREFRHYVVQAYKEMAGGAEASDLRYVSCGSGPEVGDQEAYAAHLRACLAERMPDERRRGTTLVGPHRDEVAMTLNGISVPQYASQGQHKTLLVALKAAEFKFLRDRTGETPLFLLDDVFSELDVERSRRMLTLLRGFGQLIMTTTDDTVLHGAVEWGQHHRRYHVQNGTCRPD